MTIALAIPPLTVKNRGGALIRDRALNWANMVLKLKVTVHASSLSHFMST